MPRTTSTSSSIFSYSSFILGIVTGLLLVITTYGFLTFIRLTQTPIALKDRTSAQVVRLAHVSEDRHTAPKQADGKRSSSSSNDRPSDRSDDEAPVNPPTTSVHPVKKPTHAPSPAAQPTKNTERPTESVPPSPERDDTSQQQLLGPIQDTTEKLLDTLLSIEIRL